VKCPTGQPPETPVSFFLLKSYVDNILLRLGFDPDRLTVTESGSELFSEGIRYESGKNKLAELGVVTSSLLRKTGVETDVYYADLDWGLLLSENKNHIVKFRELPKYPEVRRDLALVIDKEVRFSRLKELAFRTEKQLLRKVSLFDIYEGKGIPEGKKSYAISFVLRDDNKTLNDRQIEKAMERLLTVFTKELGAALRG
jgi:phenylalanyl-tRNA synthetase beta chain